MARFVKFFCFVFPSQLFFTLFFSVSLFFFFFFSFLLSVRVSRFFSESVLVQSSKLLPVLLWGRFAGCLSVSKFRQLLCCSVTVFLETEHLCPLSASLYTLYVRVSLSVIAGMKWLLFCHVRCHWVFSAVWLDPVDGVGIRCSSSKC